MNADENQNLVLDKSTPTEGASAVREEKGSREVLPLLPMLPVTSSNCQWGDAGEAPPNWGLATLGLATLEIGNIIRRVAIVANDQIQFSMKEVA